MKRACIYIAGCIIVVLIILHVIVDSASIQRQIKSLNSDINGGLNRTVTVYDYIGEPIKSYTGKFDVSESENEVYFDLNGKRVIIHGGIVIDEES